MGLIVQKYGGTSVGSIDRIITVAKHIKATVDAGNKVVVVVSAMGDETDKLLGLARQLSKAPAQREVDMLLTAGERISMSLLSIALQEQNIPSISLTGSQSGILTDAHHGNARIHRILGDRIRGGLIDDMVVIVAGFQGMSLHTKEITTLGRGGSDLTAIALAHVLNADFCEIYKDVDGIFTADPRIVPAARKLSKLSLASLLELTWSGASVLHARGAFLAKKFDIPLVIRSSFNFNITGTQVVAKKGASNMEMESIVVSAIAHKTSQSLVTIRAQHEQLFQRAIKWLWSRGESPIICHQTFTAKSEAELLYIMSSDITEQFIQNIRTFAADAQITTLDNLATITVVGEGFWQDPEFVSESLSIINKPIEYFESKNSALTICLKEEYLEETINNLHNELLQKSLLS
jgi:aspartate kinase